jgi:hypothetical protein
MSDTETEPRAPRRQWQPPGNPPLARRSPRIDDETWGIALAHAERYGYTIASYLRKIIGEYLDQPDRVAPPAQDGGKDRALARPLRTSDAMWDKVGSRALRDRTNREGVVLHADAAERAAGVKL